MRDRQKHTTYVFDGVSRQVTPEDLHVDNRGLVLRSVQEDGTVTAFADSVVVDVYKSRGDTYVKLARPFIAVSNSDTSCPSVMTGVEEHSVPLDHCCRYYHVVLVTTGKPVIRTI